MGAWNLEMDIAAISLPGAEVWWCCQRHLLELSWTGAPTVKSSQRRLWKGVSLEMGGRVCGRRDVLFVGAFDGVALAWSRGAAGGHVVELVFRGVSGCLMTFDYHGRGLMADHGRGLMVARVGEGGLQ